MSQLRDAVTADLPTVLFQADKGSTSLRPLLYALGECSSDLLRTRGQLVQIDATSCDCQLQANVFWLARSISILIWYASNWSDQQTPISVVVEPSAAELEIRIRSTSRGFDCASLVEDFESVGPDDRDRLNLALAKKVIERHGGGVAAVSLGFGLGMLITVTLPLAEVQQARALRST